MKTIFLIQLNILNSENDYDYIIFLIILFIVLYNFFKIFSHSNAKRYGYINNKKINKKNTPLFRDIPCNKNIYYANILIALNNQQYKKSNILGAVILKWIKEKRITIKKEKNIKFILSIDFPHNNKNENKLYALMYAASNDGILEDFELKDWAKNNGNDFINIFQDIFYDELTKLKKEGHIRKRKNVNECNYCYVMDDKMYDDYKELYGLYLYLNDFSLIDKKEILKVHTWDEYLMFAYLFGNADKIIKQLKIFNPKFEKYDDYIDFDTIKFISNISFVSTKIVNSTIRNVKVPSYYRFSNFRFKGVGRGISIKFGGGGSFGRGGGGGSR